MNFSKAAPIGLLSSLLLFGSCDKGGSHFSVLSSSAQYEQASTYVPRKLDVLFVVDNSGSMSASQARLSTNFPSFINFFKTKGYDFRIAVTTTDAYYGDQFVGVSCSLCNIGQTKFRSTTVPPVYVIDNNTPNLESVFATNVSVGTSGSGDERAFSSITAALNSSLNVGFHRSDAYFGVVIVSDSDDFSHDDINMNESYLQPTLHSVATYKTFLETFTGGQATTDFSVSTISVLDTTCRDLLNTEHKIGQRYMDLADATGGTKNSICENFDGVLNSISSAIQSQLTAKFNLSRQPILTSIRVLIDGVLINESPTDGWTYDAVGNSVTIQGPSKPKSGAIVTINFDPASVN